LEVNMSMKGTIGITVLACAASAGAFAQNSSRDQKTENMKLAGCLVTESDYRRAHGLGKGTLGGAGLGNEFVLVDATTASGDATDKATTEPSTAAPASPSRTSARCSETGTGQAYRLTGSRERELKPFVGRRIEVSGAFDHARDAKTAAGETNAKLPAEIAITSYREAPASASQAPASASAAAAAPPVSSTPSSVEARNQTSSRGPLPRTASREPLIGFIGLLCLSAAFGLRFWRLATS